MKKILNVANPFVSNIGLIVNTLIFVGITILNYYFMQNLKGGIHFLLYGWFILLFVAITAISGIGLTISSILSQTKLKILFVLLNLAVAVLNSIWLFKISEILK